MPELRDWIPAEEAATALEEHARKNAAARVQHGLKLDFIPGDGWEEKPPSGSKDQAQEAIDRAMRAQAVSMRIDYKEAVDKLKRLTVPQAVELLDSLPISVHEMYLVAEQEHGNRKSIMSRYPAPDPRVVETYLGIMAAAPAEAEEVADVTDSEKE